MFAGLQGWHIVILVVVILLLFAAPKLPKLAKSLGQSMKIFRKEVRTMNDDTDGETVAGSTTLPSEAKDTEAAGGDTKS